MMLLLQVLLASTVLGQTPAPSPKTTAAADPMAPLAFLVGEWRLKGKWATGDPIEVRAVYKWGIAKKCIHVETWPKGPDGKEYLRYETTLFYDPVKKELRSFGVSYDGSIGHGLVEVEGKILRFKSDPAYDKMKLDQWWEVKDKDRFVWTVQQKLGGKTRTLIEESWKRVR